LAALATPAPPAPADGEAILATWHELLDAGRMQDGDEHLAGTAKPLRAVLSPATAHALGVADGERIAVSTDRGTIVAGVRTDVGRAMDGVVWLPTNARGCDVRSTLGAAHGSTVRLNRADAPPVVGEETE
jgi:NADH-quinone oxidoreductase subunit G